MHQMVRDQINNVSRLEPAIPVGGMQTYQILTPRQTHWRAATCAEIGCYHHQRGWSTPVIAGSADEALLRSSGRRWSKVETNEAGYRVYTFPAGQKCLGASRHMIKTDRPELFVLREGDWRWLGSPRVFDRPDQWVDHFATHQDKIATIVNRG
jgi:hypothetical protein